jgi:hypothetical protein
MARHAGGQGGACLGIAAPPGGRASHVPQPRPAVPHDLHRPIQAAPNFPIWTAAPVRTLDVKAAPNGGSAREIRRAFAS